MKPGLLIVAPGLIGLILGNAIGSAAESVRRASSPGPLNVSGAGGSFAPLFSADGRFVVFTSQANNLVTNDDLAPHLDVFARDLLTSHTTLVSVNSTGIGGGNDNSVSPSNSSNGQFVAFESAASNLAGTDTNQSRAIYLRDLG